MQVVAFSTPMNPHWRWRIVNYAGEVVEESNDTFPTIASAVAQGTKRLVQMNVVDRSEPVRGYRSTTHLRGRRVRIEVVDNQIEAALKALKKQMQKDGLFQEMKRRAHYEKPSVKRKRKQAQARKKRRRALQRSRPFDDD